MKGKPSYKAFWRAMNPERVEEDNYERRIQRARAARRRRLEEALSRDPAVQLYRAEKARREGRAA